MRLAQERIPGAKARCVAAGIARAKARAYLRGKDIYLRCKDTYLRGKDTCLRGKDTYLRGKDTYLRGKTPAGRGNDGTREADPCGMTARSKSKCSKLLLSGEDLFFEGLLFEEVGVVAVAGDEFVVGA